MEEPPSPSGITTEMFSRFDQIGRGLASGACSYENDLETLGRICKTLTLVHSRDVDCLVGRLIRWRADLLTTPADNNETTDAAAVDLAFCHAVCLCLGPQLSLVSAETFKFLKSFGLGRLGKGEVYNQLTGLLSRGRFEQIANQLVDELHKRLRTDKQRLEACVWARAIGGVHLEVGASSSITWLRMLLEVFRESKIIELKHALMEGLTNCLTAAKRSTKVQPQELSEVWSSLVAEFLAKVSEWGKKSKHAPVAMDTVAALLCVSPNEMFVAACGPCTQQWIEWCCESEDSGDQQRALTAVGAVVGCWLTDHHTATGECPCH